MRIWAKYFITLSLALCPAMASDLFTLRNGTQVTNADHWNTRRGELLELVQTRFYGNRPPKPSSSNVTIQHLSDRLILDGSARETLSIMLIKRGDQSVPVRFGVVRPVSDQRLPIIIKNDSWVFDLSAMPPGQKRDHYANENRDKVFIGIRELAIDRGYAICKFVREDVALDARNSRETGVLAMYPEFDWGAITAWAWAYQPLIDHLLSTGHYDPNKIIATGHSRGGKTSLAATIFDPRIAIAAPSASGSGGTGSWKHFTPGGREQTPTELKEMHGFWFGKTLKDNLPDPGFDGYVLHALVAPRGLINTQGADDALANPRGTRKMFETSKPIFDFLGAHLTPATHWRPGGHGHLLVDWQALLDYADAYFSNAPLPSKFNNWPAISQWD